MKKFFILLVFAFNSSVIVSQSTAGDGTQAMENMAQLATGNGSNYGQSVMFYNPRRIVQGTYHLFENWDNVAVVHTTSNEKMLVKNINLNLNRNSFEAKLSNSDSIFSFTFNNISKVVINNKIYKNYYYKDDNKVYEILNENDNYILMKGFSVKLISGSPNPMANRPTDKYVRNATYFIKLNDQIRQVKLKKKAIYKELSINEFSQTKINEFIKSNSLSFKKEIDLLKILDYYDNL